MKDAACRQLICEIRERKIKSASELEKRKIELAKEYKIDNIIKNADIASVISDCKLNSADNKRIRRFLRTKPVRTGSGVANVAIMWQGRCDGECIYCPSVEGVPKSYTGREPATMRAKRNEFDPARQIENRLKQLRAIGHQPDKCELIIMGGNFLVAPLSERNIFMKSCVETFDNQGSRIVGLTFETRPDYCTDDNITWMLNAGATRVEIGCQSTDDKILKAVSRGHTTNETIVAIKRLKDAGLKVCLHWMPGLTGILGQVHIDKEMADFQKLFTADYEPDELKIYPTLVIPGTKLYDMWQKGRYDALTKEQTVFLLTELKKIIPEYVRIKRMMRDIPEQLVEQGPGTTNLRQLIQEKMKKEGQKCRCIRCREIRYDVVDEKNVKLGKIEYSASGGKEIFLQFITSERKIVAFLRLRLTTSRTALVRELHVYGQMVPVGERGEGEQHKQYGKRLLEEAENIAKNSSCTTIQVTSGIGARNYYEKLGYTLQEPYMVKKI